ncbi:hypothetical protein [Elizabethkingia miricola]|uniref:hypothetical protein n=1 Tax=Elizabethkingia miricola TaxID=172045 RepID=UPI000B34B3EB|nr:hypothetical protein [Elizabethkingia miricola]NHQ68135.1 hypothetical protein [Elizabethkingia miricola]NHQ71225.1 hypothetical protein [Elizabethkingia miricola]NHQ76573.1 hypothetical protein [Elizabethkingia miricola]UIO96391.1 hypothetical protein LYZ41_19600 [Elizabethkingia miricola]WER13176.1 hypothetical protein P0M31_19340 [Elizabethkingia miricola]
MAKIEKKIEIPVDSFNKAIRNLNTLTFSDWNINQNWFYIDLGEEFYITIQNGKYILEYSDTEVYPLNSEMTTKVNNWLKDIEREALESEAYARDIRNTEQYLTIASRIW